MLPEDRQYPNYDPEVWRDPLRCQECEDSVRVVEVRNKTEQVYEALIDAGIDWKRLKKVMDGGENWGELVHAFEILTTLGTVIQKWPKDLQ